VLRKLEGKVTVITGGPAALVWLPPSASSPRERTSPSPAAGPGRDPVVSIWVHSPGGPRRGAASGPRGGVGRTSNTAAT
jgi:hypothetical protein